MARILQRKRLVPNIHLIGPRAGSRRNPARPIRHHHARFRASDSLTIADGTWPGLRHLGLHGRRNEHPKTSLLREGDEIPVYTGPLGRPSGIKNFGTVLCVGGCFGIAAIYPIARALRNAGIGSLSLIDVRADYLLYWKDKIGRVSDRMISPHGTGRRQELRIPEAGGPPGRPPVDRIVAIGCISHVELRGASRPFKVRTMVSLNPIMVDGTSIAAPAESRSREDEIRLRGRSRFRWPPGGLE